VILCYPIEEIINENSEEELRRVQGQGAGDHIPHQQVSAEDIPIYQFRYIRTRVRSDWVGTRRTQSIERLEDRFYSKNRDRLFRYYRLTSARFGTNIGTTVDWLESGLEVNESVRSQVDDRILQTTFNQNTRMETIVGFRNFE